jgi:hypothetical protein
MGTTDPRAGAERAGGEDVRPSPGIAAGDGDVVAVAPWAKQAAGSATGGAVGSERATVTTIERVGTRGGDTASGRTGEACRGRASA